MKTNYVDIQSPNINGYSITKNDLEIAINKNQFELYFQPQLNFADCSIVSYECLIRWNHPRMGVISPTVFIPIAEKTGLIHQLGDWIINEACNKYKLIREITGFTGKQSINISLEQLNNNEFISKLQDTLYITDIAPSSTILEVTESLPLENPSIIHKLNLLQKIGISIALDDFGTGYSSLSHLDILPIQYLKIDKSFIKKIKEANAQLTILDLIIQTGKLLNIKLIAEGIETIDQLQYLKSKNCEIGQGYFIAKPLPYCQFVKWLSSWNKNY